jgi:hypothetical protein
LTSALGSLVDPKLFKFNALKVHFFLQAWFMINYIKFEARERWLVRIEPMLADISFDELYDFIYDKDTTPMVYTSLSQKNSYSYIGSTKCFKNRTAQHLAAIRGRRVHKFIASFGLQYFALIPMVTCASTTF